MSTSCEKEFTLTLGSAFSAYYKCEEAADPIIDQVGESDLTSGGGGIVQVPGIIGNGYDVEHWEAEVSPATKFKFLAHDFTVRLWVYMDWSPGILGQSQFSAIRNDFGDQSWELYMTVDGTHAGPMWRVWDTFNTEFNVNPNLFLGPGWHRIIGWVETGVEIGMRIDNTWQATTAMANPIYDPGAATGLYVANGSSSWHDRLDEIAVWDRLLTVAEMLTDWNGGAGTTYPTI